MWGRYDMCVRLIKSGADIEAFNHSGHTALVQAASQGNLAVCELLLAKGANPNVRAVATYRTALDMARMKEHQDVSFAREALPPLSLCPWPGLASPERT